MRLSSYLSLSSYLRCSSYYRSIIDEILFLLFFIYVIDVVGVVDPKILALKFGQNQVSTAEMLLTLSLWWVVVVVGVQSHFVSTPT